MNRRNEPCVSLEAGSDTARAGSSAAVCSTGDVLSGAERECLGRAATVMAEQIRTARAVCLAEGLPATMDVLPTMVQVLATNCLAEAIRTA